MPPEVIGLSRGLCKELMAVFFSASFDGIGEGKAKSKFCWAMALGDGSLLSAGSSRPRTDNQRFGMVVQTCCYDVYAAGRRTFAVLRRGRVTEIRRDGQ